MTPVRRGAAVKLLRMAKIQCGASAGVCVVQELDSSFTITSYPDFSEFEQAQDVPWTPDEISELASKIWLDPHLVNGRPLLCSMTIGTASALRPIAAVAAIPFDDASRDLRGVVFVVRTSSQNYSEEEISALKVVCRRFTDHLRAIQDLAGSNRFDLGRDVLTPNGNGHPETQAWADSSSERPTPRPSHGEATVEIGSYDTASGLPTIGPLIDHLKTLFERSRRPNVMVALIDLEGDPSELTSRLLLAGRRVRRTIRREDFVARIGRTTLAVAIELPSDVGMNDAVAISGRLAGMAEVAVGVISDDWIVHSSVAMTDSRMPDIDDDPRSGVDIGTALVQQAWAQLQSP